MQEHQVASDCRFQGLEIGVWGKGFRNSGFPRKARKAFKGAAGPHGGRAREGERERGREGERERGREGERERGREGERERENREKRFARERRETERGRDTVRQKPSEREI